MIKNHDLLGGLVLGVIIGIHYGVHFTPFMAILYVAAVIFGLPVLQKLLK